MTQCISDEYCSYLNTELVRYICKEGKCVPDPSFKPIVKTVSDVEKAVKKDIEKINPEEKAILNNALGGALQQISQGEGNISEMKKNFKQQVQSLDVKNKAAVTKVFDIVTEGAEHSKDISNGKPPEASVGMYSTALMSSPLLTTISSGATSLVGKDASKMITEKLNIFDARMFVDILNQAKNFVSSFIDISNIDDMLSGFLSQNPQYIFLIKMYIGDKGKELVKEMPKLKNILYGE